MKKVYNITESKKVKVLAKEIIQDLQKNLLKFLQTQEEKYLIKINKHHQELKDLNLKIINPLTGEISIPIIKNGTKKDHKWSLVEKKK
ncbi:hypothetical protein HOJ01_01895 [bacterium]|jgi:hypothetical protein|nr:hypothetical protein [bacterium]MBT6293537.1 hypothetical protein [bacterium]